VDASGTATSFITRSDQRFVGEVRKLIGDKLPEPTRMESYSASPAPAEHGAHARRHGKGEAQHRSGGRSRLRHGGRHAGATAKK
jgi:hypothetical protein